MDNNCKKWIIWFCERGSYLTMYNFEEGGGIGYQIINQNSTKKQQWFFVYPLNDLRRLHQRIIRYGLWYLPLNFWWWKCRSLDLVQILPLSQPFKNDDIRTIIGLSMTIRLLNESSISGIYDACFQKIKLTKRST